MRTGGRAGVVADINVTPMADIMIVLLIIFMIAISTSTSAPAMLPEARHARAAPKTAVRLTVTAQGVRVDDTKPMAVDGLAEYLRARADVSPGRIEIAVLADRDAAYETVARVLRACREAGVQDVALATRPRPGD